MSGRLRAFGLKPATPTVDELREIQKISEVRELTPEERATIARATREDLVTVMGESLTLKVKDVSLKP